MIPSDALANALQQANTPVVLLGSAVSIWAPGGVPNGMVVTTRILDEILGNSPKLPAVGRHEVEHLSHVGFEQLMECSPLRDSIRDLIAASYSGVVPNALHIALARALVRGKIHAIITTNYDDGIENALRSIGQEQCVEVIVGNSPDSSMDGFRSGGVLWKVHGCSTAPQTLIYSRSQEGRLSVGASRLLNELVQARPVVALGYSGFDFEITPQLAESAAASILWCEKPGKNENDLTSGARKLLATKPSQLFWLDISDSIRVVSGSIDPAPTLTFKVDNSLWDKFLEELRPEERFEWRLNLLEAAGLPNAIVASVPLLSQLGGRLKERHNADRLLSAAYFAGGAYRQSYDLAESVFSDVGATVLDRVDAGFRMVNALRCQRRQLRAWQALDHLDDFLKKSISDQNRLNAFRSRLRRYRFAVLDGVPGKSVWFSLPGCHAKQAGFEHLEQNLNFSARIGAWEDVRYALRWARRWRNTRKLVEDAEYFPAVPEDASRQLGLFAFDIVAARQKGDPIDEFKAINAMWSSCNVGYWPEAWKLGYSLKKNGITDAGRSQGRTVYRMASEKMEPGIVADVMMKLDARRTRFI